MLGQARLRGPILLWQEKLLNSRIVAEGRVDGVLVMLGWRSFIGA